MLRSRRYGWYVLALLASANFLNYANRNVVFPMYDDLRGAFSLSNAELGLLGTAFMVTHAMVTLPIGWAADRLDRRRVMAAGLVVWSLAALGSIFATGFYSMIASRAVIGIGTAACVPVANALLCDLFPDEQKARTVSIFNIGLFVGGVVGIALGAMVGFPLGFLVVGGPGLIIAYLVATIDLPAPERTDTHRMSWTAFVRDTGAVLSIKPMRWMMVGAVFDGVRGWWVPGVVHRFSDHGQGHVG